ncbi:MAG: hypothetical protein MI724_07100, partial [Spirochaetales bacterium]|nr:hypothetical protein [Spirochaetales bacterium]
MMGHTRMYRHYARFLFATILGIVATSVVAAQDYDAMGQDARVQLDRYLDRADRERSREAWLRVAEFGELAAFAEWERAAVELGAEAAQLAIERSHLAAEFETLLAERLGRWLIESFFAAAPMVDPLELYREVAAQQLSLLFATDTDGAIVFDDAGDPVLRGAENIEADEATFEAALMAEVEVALDVWTAAADAYLPELEATIESDDDAFFASLFGDTRDSYRERYAANLALIVNRESERFVAARTEDQFSTHTKTLEETAGAVVEALIETTEASLQEGLAALADGLQLDTETDEVDHVFIDPAEWEASFRREFERGLARWDEAERDLLLRRAEWEQQALEDIQVGELAWVDAYEQLIDRRNEWTRELNELIAAGQEQWDEKEAEMAAAIERAREELAGEIASRSRSLSDRVGGLVGIMNQSVALMRSARDSAKFYLDDIAEFGSNRQQSDRIRDLVDEFARNAANVGVRIDGVLGAGWRDRYSELAFWADTFETYEAFLNDAEQQLADTYGLVLTGGGADALLTAGVNELLTADAWEGVYLDAYQVELLKANAVKAYWDDQVEIARSVADYAADTSSAKKTEAETQADYDHAAVALEEAHGAYEAAVQTLEAAGETLSTRQEELAEVQQRLAEAEAALAAAQEDFQIQLAAAQVTTSDAFRRQVQQQYDLLQELYGYGEDPENSIATSYAAYLEAARRHEVELLFQTASEMAAALVLGIDIGGAPSLAELQEAADLRHTGPYALPDSDATPEGIVVDEIALTDHLIAALGWELDETHRATPAVVEIAAINAAESIQSRTAALLRINLFVASERERADAGLRTRLDQLSLLTTDDVDGWFASLGIEVPPAGATTADYLTALERAAAAQRTRSLLTRADWELAAIALLTDDAGLVTDETDWDAALEAELDERFDPAAALAVALRAEFRLEDGTLDHVGLQAHVDGWLSALTALHTALEAVLASEDPTLEAHEAALTALVDGDALTRRFFTGAGLGSVGERDYGARLVDIAELRAARAGHALSAWLSFEEIAPTVVVGRRTDALEGVRTALVD